MKILRNACLSLLLLSAPISVVWGAEAAKENAQIAKTASKVNLPPDCKPTDAARRAQIKKEKEAVRKVVESKKKQRQTTARKPAKAAKPTTHAGKPPRKPTQAAKKPNAAPGYMGIRTWTYPATSAERTNKINELTARITETEKAYDAENAKFQKLQKESMNRANPAPVTPANEPALTSQRRINEILQQLDALHQHRNNVAELVFLKTVRD
ncbi:MAG: hypothetical protein HQL95_15745 [Magnetococcales bacterium]|nr:hypothetical protein [Magnetococcales bacterium]